MKDGGFRPAKTSARDAAQPFGLAEFFIRSNRPLLRGRSSRSAKTSTNFSQGREGWNSSRCEE
jgi:hypothetical protein